MNYQIILYDVVSDKLDEAAKWYEEKQLGLGEDFISEFYLLLKYVEKIPNGFPIAFGKFRQVILKRFPYIILYKIVGQTIEVANLIHAKQNPKKRIVKKS